jgi:hypothetical protein
VIVNLLCLLGVGSAAGAGLSFNAMQHNIVGLPAGIGFAALALTLFVGAAKMGKASK